MKLLAINGVMIMVGAAPNDTKFSAFDFIPRRKSLVGSLIGGI